MSYESDHNVQATSNEEAEIREAREFFDQLIQTVRGPNAPESMAFPMRQWNPPSGGAAVPMIIPFFEAMSEQLRLGETKGMSDTFIDSLDRFPKRSLKPDDNCPVCATKYLEDDNPLVVVLPCPGRHKFDLECIAPWLKRTSTCPMCRHDFMAARPAPVIEDDEEEEEDASMFG